MASRMNHIGMASPLIGIAAQNSLLFTAFQMSKRAVSSTQNITIQQTVAAGAMAGAINSIMASPIELFKIRMQAQYGGQSDRKLRQVAADLWREHGFRRGVMRGFWVRCLAGWYGGVQVVFYSFTVGLVALHTGHCCPRNAGLCWLLRRIHIHKGGAPPTNVPGPACRSESARVVSDGERIGGRYLQLARMLSSRCVCGSHCPVFLFFASTIMQSSLTAPFIPCPPARPAACPSRRRQVPRAADVAPPRARLHRDGIRDHCPRARGRGPCARPLAHPAQSNSRGRRHFYCL